MYFKQTKYKSFQRQTNIYGFRRIQTGPNKGGYSHKYFIRQQTPELCDLIMRRSANQSSDSDSSSSSDDKNMQEVEPISLDDDLSTSFTKSSGSLKLHGSEVNTFYSFFYPEDPAEKARISFIFDQGNTKTTQDGRISNSVNNDPVLAHSVTSSCIDGDLSVANNSFPWKVHLMLEEAEKQKFQHIVSWVNNGSAFKVHNTEEFVTKVMPNYFDQTMYESFRRQLNLYGFARVTRGADRGEISHAFFIKGSRLRCEMIKKPKS
jgi:hypothetical protein